jgi:predicted Kef-type K+ transport protein
MDIYLKKLQRIIPWALQEYNVQASKFLFYLIFILFPIFVYNGHSKFMKVRWFSFFLGLLLITYKSSWAHIAQISTLDMYVEVR